MKGLLPGVMNERLREELILCYAERAGSDDLLPELLHNSKDQ
jgi:hypothetical protein